MADGTHPDRGVRWLALIVFTVWLVIMTVILVRAFLTPQLRNEYLTYVNAARDWREGQDIYRLNDHSPALFVYAPTAAILMAPFSYLPDEVGGVVWRVLNLGVYLGGAFWWFRCLMPEALSRRHSLILGLMILPLSLASLSNGQINPLLVGLLLAGVAAAAKQRWNMAALCLGLACILKIYVIALALLMVLAFPRRFAIRWLAVVALGLSLPFVLEGIGPACAEYARWRELLHADDRTNWALDVAPMDLWLLFRVAGIPLSHSAYLVLQLTLAAAMAGLCLAGGLRGFSRRRLCATITHQACCWMILCGPATAWSTYMLLAPSLAWVVLEAWRCKRPNYDRWTATIIYSLFVSLTLVRIIPDGHKLLVGAHPCAALLFMLYVTAQQLADLRRQADPHFLRSSFIGRLYLLWSESTPAMPVLTFSPEYIDEEHLESTARDKEHGDTGSLAGARLPAD